MTGFVPVEVGLGPERVAELVAEEAERLEPWSGAARLGDLTVRCVAEPGDPREGILRVADREGADLIVVGRIGHSDGPGPLHFGSMAEWLAHNSRLPVAVVGGAVSASTRSVLVGVDGSEGSRAAVRWVRDLAAVSDIRVVVAAVDQPYLEWTPASSPENWRRELEKTVREDYANDLTEAGVEFTTMALRGSNVADTLLQAARDERTDIVVVGARGLGGFTGLRIGGVALKTLHRADRPVVMVTPTTE